MSVHGKGIDPCPRFDVLLQLLERLPPTAAYDAGKKHRSGVITNCTESKAREIVRKLGKTATHMYEELGPWAVEFYVFHSTNRNSPLAGFADGQCYLSKKELGGRICRKLDQPILRTEPQFCLVDNLLSHKVRQLLSFLERQGLDECRGLVFVQQRAAVSVLQAIIANHPRTAQLFRCATFVGNSNSRRDQAAMFRTDVESSKDALANFRKGAKNLMIATDALEEGIDVPACNLVVCFDPPPTLKSYIQRRGRARMEGSLYVIMHASGSNLQDFSCMEQRLIDMYRSKDRERQKAALMESQAEPVSGQLVVDRTG